ncbi:MAG: hypothetical protein ACPGJV_05505 [Bacteriovoracaceae bacterium]
MKLIAVCSLFLTTFLALEASAQRRSSDFVGETGKFKKFIGSSRSLDVERGIRRNNVYIFEAKDEAITIAKITFTFRSGRQLTVLDNDPQISRGDFSLRENERVVVRIPNRNNGQNRAVTNIRISASSAIPWGSEGTLLVYSRPGRYNPTPRPRPRPRYGSCDIEYSNGKFYVSVDGRKATNSSSFFSTAKSDFKRMLNRGECYEATSSLCTVAYSNGKFYVTKEGRKASNSTSFFSTALSSLREYKSVDLCYVEKRNSTCDIAYSNGSYYVTKNYNKSANSTSFLSTAYSNLREYTNANLCLQERPTRCRIQRSNSGKFYVLRDGAKFSNSTSFRSTAESNLSDMQSKGLCRNRNR